MLEPQAQGTMLHGVDSVVIIDSEGGETEIQTDGRVYMWPNGWITVYRSEAHEPWWSFPPQRVLLIEGSEHG